MSKEVVLGPVRPRPVKGQQDKGRYGILGTRRRGDPTRNIVQNTAVRYERIQFLAGQSFTHGQEGDTQKEEVVTGVKAVPKGRHAVGRDETATRAHVHVPGEPFGCVAVPFFREDLDARGGFKGQNVIVVVVIPAFGLALVIKAFETGVPDVAGAFGAFPSKVVLLTDDQETHPEVSETNDPCLLEELGCQDDRGIVLWISGVQQGKVATGDNEKDKIDETGQEWLESRKDIARNLSLGCPILVVDVTPSTSLFVNGKFGRRTGNDIGKAKCVTKKLDQRREFLNRVLFALFRGATVPALGKDFAIVQVEGHHVEFLCNDHLGAREIQVIAKVVNVLTVQMGQDHVDHGKDGDEGSRLFAGQDHEHTVGNERCDELVDPLDAENELQ